MYEDLPEIEEFMRVFPVKIDAKLRDKYGNISVFVVPHCGGSEMAKGAFHKMGWERFADLFLYFTEHLRMIVDKLTEEEKWFVCVNYIWDGEPFSPLWTNDMSEGVRQRLLPALDKQARWYTSHVDDQVFIVNVFSWYAYAAKEARRGVSLIASHMWCS